jgi:hypothetical protein
MKLFSLFILLFSLIIFPVIAEAKVLPQAVKSTVKQAVKSTGTTIGVVPRLRADRRAVIVNFSNLQNTRSVSYMLVYKHDGQEEAAMGALALNGQSSDKVELLFATCSASVCRYHSGIKDARLEVSYTSTNGKKYLKKFKIKL